MTPVSVCAASRRAALPGAVLALVAAPLAAAPDKGAAVAALGLGAIQCEGSDSLDNPGAVFR